MSAPSVDKTLKEISDRYHISVAKPFQLQISLEVSPRLSACMFFSTNCQILSRCDHHFLFFLYHVSGVCRENELVVQRSLHFTMSLKLASQHV